MNPLRLFAYGLPLSLALVAGCATQAPTAPQPSPTTTPAEMPTATDLTEPVETLTKSRPFDRETLFELLVAEFAGKRDRPDLALGTYLKAAHKTRDPLVAERATAIARYMGANQAALDASLLWSEVDPKNPAAHEAAATLLIRFNRLDEAMNHIEILLENNIELNFDFLLNATRNADQRTISQLVGRLDGFLQKYPENYQLWFTRGLLKHEQDKTQGLEDIEQSLMLQPTYANALIAKARLLEERNQPKQARNILSEATQASPGSKRLGLAYARLLLRQKRIGDAHKEFARLVDAFPDDSDLVLSLALVAWENDQEAVAIEQLEKLVETDRASEAHSYLGRIAAARNDRDNAIEHFRMVEVGPHFTAARIQMAALQAAQKQIDSARQTLAQARQRAPQDALQYYMMESELLADAGRTTEALAVLDEATGKNPGDLNILYARGMMLGELKRWDDMERVMRTIIERDPKNTDALNALGYTLADRNVRLDEAEKLITQALSLAPKNPAIIDSMGWLKYRRGDTVAALELLRAAYKEFPDHEVAAHLGEVLWITGQKEEATLIWTEGLKKTPDSKLIREAMQRLAPAPTTPPK
jgi:tetratricopeptide (TPR) repeat protein